MDCYKWSFWFFLCKKLTIYFKRKNLIFSFEISARNFMDNFDMISIIIILQFL